MVKSMIAMFLIIGLMLAGSVVVFREKKQPDIQNRQSEIITNIQVKEIGLSEIKTVPKKPILYDDDNDGWVTVPDLDLKIKCLNLEKRIYEDC